MKKINDGDPAFPTPTPFAGEGMSLRDWFAGQALIGILASEIEDTTLECRAKFAFALADAMLSQRSKQPVAHSSFMEGMNNALFNSQAR